MYATIAFTHFGSILEAWITSSWWICVYVVVAWPTSNLQVAAEHVHVHVTKDRRMKEELTESQLQQQQQQQQYLFANKGGLPEELPA